MASHRKHGKKRSKSKGGKKKSHRKLSARARGKKVWASFVRKHGGLKKAKAALARRFAKGRRKGKRK